MNKYQKFKKIGPFHTDIAVVIALVIIMVLVFLSSRFDRSATPVMRDEL